MNTDKRLVLVLGMHRSGTSALIKSLEVLGVELGSNFNPATPDNPTGFWEDKNFHALNEEMLKHLHRSWDDLQLVESDTVLSGLEGFFSRARILLDDFLRDKSVAGLKDPRFSLLLPFWKKLFAEAEVRVSFVVGFRHPLSVVQSLSRRDDFPKIKSLWLWTLHHVFIAAEMTDVSRLVVDYDQMLEHSHGQLDRLACFLSLAPDFGSLDKFCSEFLQPDLRHAHHSSADLPEDLDCPPIVLDIYEHFSAASSDTAPAGLVSWKEAASSWERSLRPFKGLLHLSSVLGQEKVALKTQAAYRQLKIHEQLLSLEAGQSGLVQKNAELAHKNTALDEQTAEQVKKIAALDQQTVELAHKNAALDQEVAQLLHKSATLDQEVAQLLHKNAALDQEVAQLAQQNTVLDQQAAQLLHQNDALDQRVAQLVQKNAALDQQAAQLLHQNAALGQKVVQLTEKNTALDQQNAELTRKNATLDQDVAQLTQRNAALDQEVAQLTQSNAALDQEVAQLTQRNAALDQEVAQLVHKNAALDQEAVKLAQKNTAIGQEAAELNRKIREMETSFSWKITTPLRSMGVSLKHWGSS